MSERHDDKLAIAPKGQPPRRFWSKSGEYIGHVPGVIRDDLAVPVSISPWISVETGCPVDVR